MYFVYLTQNSVDINTAQNRKLERSKKAHGKENNATYVSNLKLTAGFCLGLELRLSVIILV